MKNKFTYQSSKLSRWLFTVFVFFSSLSFSGYTGNSVSSQQEENLAAPLYAANFKSGKRTISYKRAIAFAYREKVLANAIRNKTNALSDQRRLIKIKIADNLIRSFSFTTSEHYVHVKTIHQGSDEDVLHSLAG